VLLHTRNPIISGSLALLCLAAASVQAQPKQKPEAAVTQSAPALPPAQTETLNAALRGLAKQRGLDADARKQAEDLLHQALEDESRADQLAQQWQILNQAAASADADAQKLEDEQTRDDSATLAAWRATLPEHATVEQLEALAAHERDAAADARAWVSAIENELARQTTRPAQLRDELTAAHAALDANRVAPGTNGDIVSQAQRLHAQSAQRLTTIQIALLNLENRSYEPRMRLLSAQLRERQRAVIALGQHVGVLEATLLDRTGADVAALQARVARERADIDPRARMLLEYADANGELIARLVETVREIGVLRAQKLDWDSGLRETTQALKNTE